MITDSYLNHVESVSANHNNVWNFVGLIYLSSPARFLTSVDHLNSPVTIATAVFRKYTRMRTHVLLSEISAR